MIEAYTGRCPYCGREELIWENSQEEADLIVAKNCSCKGYKLKQKEAELYQKLEEVSKECKEKNFRRIDKDTLSMIKEVATACLMGRIQQVQFDVLCSKVTITRTAYGVKITRKSTSIDIQEV